MGGESSHGADDEQDDEPDQQLLLPAALQEWLPSDHLAHFVSDVVDQLDLPPSWPAISRGGPPYHPR